MALGREGAGPGVTGGASVYSRGMAVAEQSEAILLADEFRHGRATCRPFQLWQIANREAGGHIAARLVRFRHSMMHAGYLLTAKGKPYKRCPMCRAALR